MKRFFLLSLLGLLAFSCDRQQKEPFDYRIAIIGNPTNPDIRYDDAQMSALKDLGFNMLQLNIAWGARPADEPLNLEDILYIPGRPGKERTEERLKDIQTRAKIAKKWGFRTLFHFGAPCVDTLYKKLRPDLVDKTTFEHSIQRPEIVEKYVELLKRLKQEVPELDDIQLYTFDQEAWIGNEFGDDSLARGIPLAERLPAFIRALTEAWAEVNPDGRLWWEPWEISAGQVYEMMPQLPTEHFGFFLHSNIAEVQATRPVDIWFRNMLSLANQRGIPVVGEVFMGSANEEVQYLENLSAPRLVGEQVDAIYNQPGIAGIKEYFGIIPDKYDPSMLMAGLKLNDPSLTNQEAIEQLAKPYGEEAPAIKDAWELSAQGLSLFPWDATWLFRNIMENPMGIRVYHQWYFAYISGKVAPSPSWKSTRRSLFMTTEEEVLDPWFFEDIELRSKASAEKFLAAIDKFEAMDTGALNQKYADYIAANIKDLQEMEQMVTAFRCYCRESNLAFLMRKYLDEGQPIPQQIIDRFEQIMAIDIANQNKGYAKDPGVHLTAEKMLVHFREDPAEWARTHLLFGYPY